MIRTIIIDDEAKARRVISGILEKRCPNILVVAEAESVKSGIEKIKKFNPDLVVLDIQLTDGTGFDLLEQLGKVSFKIIFITAYQEYAIKAIRISALDYILKPVKPDELIAAVERADDILSKENFSLRLEALLANQKKEEKQIVLKSANSFYVKNIHDIIRCEADGNYTQFYFQDGKNILISKSLIEYEEMLQAYGFFRVHNAHLINIAFIEKCDKSKGGFVYMNDNSAVPISRTKKQDLLDMLDKM